MNPLHLLNFSPFMLDWCHAMDHFEHMKFNHVCRKSLYVLLISVIKNGQFIFQIFIPEAEQGKPRRGVGLGGQVAPSSTTAEMSRGSSQELFRNEPRLLQSWFCA